MKAQLKYSYSSIPYVDQSSSDNNRLSEFLPELLSFQRSILIPHSIEQIMSTLRMCISLQLSEAGWDGTTWDWHSILPFTNIIEVEE